MDARKQVVRRPKAAEDIENHATYIAAYNLDAALRFLERAEQTINDLAQFPGTGAPFLTRIDELKGMRSKLIPDFPNHVVFYIERNDVIEVVRVLRGGQDMSAEVSAES